jgi:ATP-dependent Clp protease ATP-binding subunit ClpA
MTRDRRSKQAIRARMAESGLKYTEARRELSGARGGGGGGGVGDRDDGWPGDVIGGFSDQAYNLVLLAEDETRMLGRSIVEPGHLLLALSRRGNAQRLLEMAGVGAGDIYQALVSRDGVGNELVRGRVPRSARSEGVLVDAVLAAADRGRGPSSEDVLLGLNEDPSVRGLLGGIGVGDLRALIDQRYPRSGPSLDPQQALRWAQHHSETRQPPRPGPIPPVFERYAPDARAAIEMGERTADEMMHPYVEPFHFLVGCALIPDTTAQRLLVAEGVTGEAARERARLHGPDPAGQATGIFSDLAREIVAESALEISHRAQASAIDTRHLLAATISSQDPRVHQLFGSEAATRRVAEAIQPHPTTSGA